MAHFLGQDVELGPEQCSDSRRSDETSDEWSAEAQLKRAMDLMMELQASRDEAMDTLKQYRDELRGRDALLQDVKRALERCSDSHGAMGECEADRADKTLDESSRQAGEQEATVTVPSGEYIKDLAVAMETMAAVLGDLPPGRLVQQGIRRATGLITQAKVLLENLEKDRLDALEASNATSQPPSEELDGLRSELEALWAENHSLRVENARLAGELVATQSALN